MYRKLQIILKMFKKAIVISIRCNVQRAAKVSMKTDSLFDCAALIGLIFWNTITILLCRSESWKSVTAEQRHAKYQIHPSNPRQYNAITTLNLLIRLVSNRVRKLFNITRTKNRNRLILSIQLTIKLNIRLKVDASYSWFLTKVIWNNKNSYVSLCTGVKNFLGDRFCAFLQSPCENQIFWNCNLQNVGIYINLMVYVQPFTRNLANSSNKGIFSWNFQKRGLHCIFGSP